MKPTPAMIGAAHDVTMKEAGIILSHELIAKIYDAMQAQAANADALGVLREAVGGVGHLARCSGVNVAEWEAWELKARAVLDAARSTPATEKGE